MEPGRSFAVCGKSRQRRYPHATRRQVQIYRKAGTQGRSYRGKLRKPRRAREGGRAPGLGDGQQGERRRQEKRLRPRPAGEPCRLAQGRTARRRGLRRASGGGALGRGEEGGGDAQAQRRGPRAPLTIRKTRERPAPAATAFSFHLPRRAIVSPERLGGATTDGWGMLHLDWRFLPVFDRVDPNSAYAGVYQAGLVALSVLVAAIAAFVALSISGRIAAAGSRRERWAWASAGAAAMGGGIWGMHFIGMLAFSLPCGVSYNPPETILSMIPGILASGVALHIISDRREPTFGRLLIGAVALSFVALGIRFRLRAGHGTGVVATAIAAPVMGCAVAGMHYTAMQASVFYPLADAQLSLMSMSPGLLAGLITVFTVLIMGTVLVAAFAGRQVELARELAAEVARREVLETDAENGRARLQAIFDAAVDAIVTVDEGGRILQWSKGAERILGYSADEAVGEDFSMLMPPRRRRRRRRYLQFALASQHRGMTGSGRETVAQRKDGSEFPVELSISRVRAGSEFLLTGILRDITERKRVEQDLIQARVQAEAANRAKSQFLATMSHEMRTPLNGVLGTTNLLAGTRLTARQTRLVQNLERSGQALLGVISDILDLSKIEAGRFELAANDFEPRELVAEVTDLFAERCAAKGLEFVYFVAETVPGRLRGDAARLRQILINLVGNAMKFTEQGEIYLELEASEIGPDEATLTCSVRYTGIGMPRDQQERIFSSFHQVDASTTRSRGGSGLGLAIVTELVSLMGGQVGDADP